jgi:hypothetical protein
MYRRVSLIDMRNTYPANSRPAVPNMFRTTLNVFIVLPSKPIWRASSMPWFSKRFSPVECDLDGRDLNGYAGITWAASTTAPGPIGRSSGKFDICLLPAPRKFDSKKYIDQIASLEQRRSHSLRSRGTLIKFLYQNCASGNFGVLYEALLHADKLFTELPASSVDIRRSHNVDSN